MRFKYQTVDVTLEKYRKLLLTFFSILNYK